MSETNSSGAQFLYRVRPTRPGMLTHRPTAQEAAVVDDHFKYLHGLTAQGIVLLAGRTLNNDERTFGIVVLNAPNEAQAERLMNADPAVVLGVMQAELFPFRVALWSLS